MLAYILALAVGFGSLGIYLAAFFFPEIHRKNDFIWSGVGLFYALVLWVCAGRITGGLLLGQIAGVALLGWSVTQTLQLRRQLTPSQQQTAVPSAAELKNTVQGQVSKLSLPQRLSQLGQRFSGSANAAKSRLQQVTDGAKRQSQTQATTPQSAAGNPNVKVIDHRTPSAPPTTPAAPTEEESPLGAEPPVNTNQPGGPDMPGPRGEEVATVAEIAPDAELAPPAETIGAGDPQGRQDVTSPSIPVEAVPKATSQPTVSDAELKRPDPPEAELVEAAIEDAEEKHQPASPPESAEHDSAQANKSAESS